MASLVDFCRLGSTCSLTCCTALHTVVLKVHLRTRWERFIFVISKHTECFCYCLCKHGSCHGLSRQMQASCAIKLSCTGNYKKKHPLFLLLVKMFFTEQLITTTCGATNEAHDITSEIFYQISRYGNWLLCVVTSTSG